MKTLAYDCGNPVQYVCGRSARSAFLFLNSLTTPPRAPLQWRGTWYVPSRAKVPLCGGVARSTRVVIVVIVPHPVVQSMPPPKAVGITCTLHSNKKRGGAPFFFKYCLRLSNDHFATIPGPCLRCCAGRL